MGDIVNLLQSGTPRTLFTNALAESEGIECALVVMLRKDGVITSDWSKISSGALALGLVDILHRAVLKEI